MRCECAGNAPGRRREGLAVRAAPSARNQSAGQAARHPRHGLFFDKRAPRSLFASGSICLPLGVFASRSIFPRSIFEPRSAAAANVRPQSRLASRRISWACAAPLNTRRLAGTRRLLFWALNETDSKLRGSTWPL
eukprot:scaffold2830_cov123-Isochrysis_galbana.AAC.23